MLDLPIDILYSIFVRIKYCDILQIQLVCSRFYSICDSGHFKKTWLKTNLCVTFADKEECAHKWIDNPEGLLRYCFIEYDLESVRLDYFLTNEIRQILPCSPLTKIIDFYKEHIVLPINKYFWLFHIYSKIYLYGNICTEVFKYAPTIITKDMLVLFLAKYDKNEEMIGGYKVLFNFTQNCLLKDRINNSGKRFIFDELVRMDNIYTIDTIEFNSYE